MTCLPMYSIFDMNRRHNVDSIQILNCTYIVGRLCGACDFDRNVLRSTVKPYVRACNAFESIIDAGIKVLKAFSRSTRRLWFGFWPCSFIVDFFHARAKVNCANVRRVASPYIHVCECVYLSIRIHLCAIAPFVRDD